MRRRDILKSLGGAAALWTLSTLAQTSAVPVIGFAATGGDASARAAKAATIEIPVVFTIGGTRRADFRSTVLLFLFVGC